MDTVAVVRVSNNHGFPYAAVCLCGWHSVTYCATHAAASIANDHTVLTGHRFVDATPAHTHAIAVARGTH